MSTIHVSTDPAARFLAPARLALVPVAPTTPAPVVARSAPRPKKRRKVKRPPQPRIPEDFFDEQAQLLVKELFSSRADCWQRDREPPVLFYGSDSEPQWDASARKHCSGTTLRRANLRVFFDSLSIDLERGLRLLCMTWTDDNLTTEGNHDLDEWRMAFSGVLWRVGQHYREFARRWGQERAREMLSLTMQGLWRGEPRRPYHP